MASPPSPFKRVKLSSSYGQVATAASAVIADEPALLANIVNFMPATTTENKSKTNASDALQTVVSLCRAVPGLSKFLGPANEAFWKSMVLSHFDFTINADKTLNMEAEDEVACSSLHMMMDETLDEHGYLVCKQGDEDNADDDCDDQDDEQENEDTWETHPARDAVAQWEAKQPARPQGGRRGLGSPAPTPAHILANDLKFWSSLGAYFRPAEYHFLSDIQVARASMDAWPAHEDAFTLYCDLLLLVDQLAAFDEDLFMWVYGEEAWVDPIFLGRLDGPITKRGIELLRHCDILPHFWSSAPSKRWEGFDRPQPPLVPLVVKDDPNRCRSYDVPRFWTDQEAYIFPSAYDKPAFDRLCRIVYDSFSDWRSVDVNQGKERMTPIFFIGPTKKSGRWLGFIGLNEVH